MQRFRQLTQSVFFKFSAAFIAVGLIPLSLLSFYSVQTFTSHVERYTEDNLRQMVLYMSYNVNSALTQYDDISKLMYTGRYDGYVEGSADNQTRNVNELEQINSVPIDGFLKTLLYSDSYITSVYFIRESDGKLYYQSKVNTAFVQDKLPLAEWLPVLRERPRNVAFFPTHKMDYYHGSSRDVLTVGRNLIDTSGPLTAEPKVVGTLLFDVDTAMFDPFFAEMKLSQGDELFVLDGGGRAFFSNRQDVYGSALELETDTNGKMLTISEPIPYLQGTVVASISKSRLFEQLATTRSAVFIAILACGGVLIGMGIWFSRRLAAPIRSVIQGMVKAESGHLETRVAVRSQDEIGRLGHGFNRMVARLKAFIDDAYVAEIKQKQAELNALKSQIRPHYLYNTLEVIRMNAVHSDAPEVGEMILSLSNQLKYVIDYGEEWVTLREELDHLRDYFYIIEVRFENRYELRIDIAEDVNMDWAVPKLSLQPFVENAVQHGLKPQGRGSIEISIVRQQDRLALTVTDDGIGMDKPEADRIAKMLASGGAPAGHVGIKNVHERIRSLCGESFGVAVTSRPHIGTSVTLEIPIREVPKHDPDSARG